MSTKCLLVLLFIGGCADNQSRCERATKQINNAREACGLETIDAQSACFGFSDLNDANCSAYFACDADRYSCEEGQLLQTTEVCPPCE